MKAIRLYSAVVALAIGSLAPGAAAQSDEPPPAASITAGVFREVVRRQNPTVVSIAARSRVPSWRRQGEAFFRLFGVTPPPADEPVQHVAASGIIVSAAGDILTNNHVVEGADAIEVGLFGDERRRHRAFRVGGDPVTDIALIRLEAPPRGLRVAVLGDSNTLQPGDFVVAIGNPFELGHTVTVGVVSSERRPFQIEGGHRQDLIQTDAAINPGNSGGPLLNTEGEVVGINVAVLDAKDSNSTGIGFAIPINRVKGLLPQLRNGNVVRAHLGVQLHDGPMLEDEARELGLLAPTGALAMSVDDKSGANRAGLRPGDVIVDVDGHTVADARDLIARTSAMAPGTAVKVRFFRDGVEQSGILVLDELPCETRPGTPSATPSRHGGLSFGGITPSWASLLDVPPSLEGALVTSVAPGSAGEGAGLAVGDIIRAINRHPVHHVADAKRELESITADRPIFLLVWRRGKELFLRMRRD
jgi:serine protease Do